MANDVINPRQVFRDKKGKPAQGGFLRVYVNRTTQIGTAFSDSALTIEQAVNPYPLDRYGATKGDLRWAGERTLELYDSDDNYIRTYNDVVTALDTSEFAINLASVADMVADQSLEIGDVVETQSYNADQGMGGARYLIVAGSTGTDDGYLYHDLDNGLQAQLLDLEINNNFYVAGAIGNGATDDSDAVQALFSQGGEIDCSNGTFLATGLKIDSSARVTGDGTLLQSQFASQPLLELEGEDLFLQFEGITLDGDSANQVEESTLQTILSSCTTTGVSVVQFNNVNFVNGNFRDIQVQGDDATTLVLYAFGGCNFVGGLEATDTPYAPAYAEFESANVLFENCYFDLDSDPDDIGGRGGILTAATAELTNPGWIHVFDNTFNRIGAVADVTSVIPSVYISDMGSASVVGNRFINSHGGAVGFRAEVTDVKVSENNINQLTGAHLLGGVYSEDTTYSAPGDNWDITANEFVEVGAIPVNISGASGGVDASNLYVNGNIIDTPFATAIVIQNIDTASIDDNQIDLDDVSDGNGIEIGTDGISGQVSIEGNEILNCGATAILNEVTSSAVFNVNHNTIESADEAIRIINTTGAFITNNDMQSIDTLITVGGLTDCTIEGNSAIDVTGTYANVTDTITNLIVGENLWQQLDDTITEIAYATSIAITAHYHRITGGGGALATITMPYAVDGWVLTLTAEASTTLTETGGNLNLGGTTRALDDPSDTLTLVYDQPNDAWNEMAFANNG